MKIINSMIFITLSCLIGTSQAMEKKEKKSSFRQKATHKPMVFNFSDFVGKVNSILGEIVKNNGEIVKSESLLKSEKDRVNQESTFLTAIQEILGKKEYTIEGNAGGRMEHNSLKKIVEGIEEFGVILEDFKLHRKINEECYDKYTSCFESLKFELDAIELIKDLQTVSQEELIGSPREGSPRRNRFAKIGSFLQNKQL